MASQPPQPEKLSRSQNLNDFEPPAFLFAIVAIVRAVFWVFIVAGGTKFIQNIFAFSLFESAVLSLGMCLLLNLVNTRARLSNIEHLMEVEKDYSSGGYDLLENFVEQMDEDIESKGSKISREDHEDLTRDDLDLELIELLEEKRTIEAINLYREHTGCGLKEAKRYIKSL